MANTKSAIKNARKSEARASRNRAVLSELKTLGKKVATLRKGGQPDAARAAAIEYTSALDKAAKRKVIHPNAASRRKSALSAVVFPKSGNPS